MLPPLWSTSRAPATSFFRGSITRPQRSLSTLRSLPRGKTTQDSLASWWPTFAARDWLPAGLLSRFQLMFPPRPSLPGAMTINPEDAEIAVNSRTFDRQRAILRVLRTLPIWLLELTNARRRPFQADVLHGE